MRSLSFTVILFASYQAAYAGSVNNGGNCSTADNRLQTGSFQFWSDCNSVNYCTDQGICVPKGCRRDEFPFGYAQGANLPPKCPIGQFCPDEGSECQTLLPVGSPCQLNRDGTKFVCSFSNWLKDILDQCEAPSNYQDLADTSGRGLNFNGSVCLNNQCMSVHLISVPLIQYLNYQGGLMLRWVRTVPLKIRLILRTVHLASLSILCPGMINLSFLHF